MKGSTMNISSAVFVPVVLGLICASIVFAVLAGKQWPLVSSPRAALVALLILGLAMCTGGIGQVGASGRWGSPLAILGYLLGAAILVVIAAAFAGWKLPGIHSESQSVAAVGLLLAAKFAIGTAGFFFHWL